MGTPISESSSEAARDEERASGNEGQFFSLIYNEQHAPAIDWFGDHGWHGDRGPIDRLLPPGRPAGARAGLRGCADVRQHLPGQRH